MMVQSAVISAEIISSHVTSYLIQVSWTEVFIQSLKLLNYDRRELHSKHKGGPNGQNDRFQIR